MTLQLSNTINEIEQVLSNHSKAVSSLSATIGVTGTQMSTPEYSDLLTQYVGLNGDTFGIGVWYDYNGYKPEIKYFGPMPAATAPISPLPKPFTVPMSMTSPIRNGTRLVKLPAMRSPGRHLIKMKRWEFR